MADWHIIKGKNNYQLCVEGDQFDCLVGRAGIVSYAQKREGDEASPKGRWPMRGLWYRPDKWALDRLASEKLPSGHGFSPRPITPNDGWCDDPACDAYNQPVDLPFSGSHETLWRTDSLYDLLIPLGYNDDPVYRGKGSAIFLHCTDNATYAKHTKGCIAISKPNLIQLLPYIGPKTHIVI